MQIRRRQPFKPLEQKKLTRVNDWIRVPEIRLIDETGNNVGVVKREEALARARVAELDLVEVNPKAVPPVCKIMDYGKYKYEQEKLAHKQKVASKKTEIKGVRLSFKIKGNDLANRLTQAKKFLTEGHQVKVEMILKGREKALAGNAQNIIENFVSDLGEEIKIIQPMQRQGGKFSLTVAQNS